MPSRFLLKSLIFCGLWSSLTLLGAPQPPAAQDNLPASVQLRAIVHFFRGANFQGDGELNQALDEYQEAVRLDNQFAEAYNNLGTVYKERKD